MGVYVFDGEMYAGWSTGRWFGLAGVVSLMAGLLGRMTVHGWFDAVSPAGMLFAVYVEYVGGILGLVMLFAACGSLMISFEQRGDVEVTPEGVTRVYGSRARKFLPRDQIAGYVVRAGGGVMLVDEPRRQRMVIPRSIEGYRECMAEINALGIHRLPGREGGQQLQWKTMSWKERIQYYGSMMAAFASFSRGEGVLGNSVCVGVCVALMGWAWLEHRRGPQRSPWMVGFIVMLVILLVRGGLALLLRSGFHLA